MHSTRSSGCTDEQVNEDCLVVVTEEADLEAYCPYNNILGRYSGTELEKLQFLLRHEETYSEDVSCNILPTNVPSKLNGK